MENTIMSVINSNRELMKKARKKYFPKIMFWSFIVLFGCGDDDLDTGNTTFQGDTGSLTDIEGNTYGIVKIGEQWWMAQNLGVTKFNNGDDIPTTDPISLRLDGIDKTDIYQWAYDGDESNIDPHGRLYTWYSVIDDRKLCPTGWHSPTNSEWVDLVDNTGGEFIAGGKLKGFGDAYWDSPNKAASNEYGFLALGSGARAFYGGFIGIKEYAVWWTSTEIDDGIAKVWLVRSSSADILNQQAGKSWGYPIRCVMD